MIRTVLAHYLEKSDIVIYILIIVVDPISLHSSGIFLLLTTVFPLKSTNFVRIKITSALFLVLSVAQSTE
jgi:hypothetical protein